MAFYLFIYLKKSSRWHSFKKVDVITAYLHPHMDNRIKVLRKKLTCQIILTFFNKLEFSLIKQKNKEQTSI